ncbi:MAG TPA: hypothetical protein VFX01_04535, partial [Methylophilaceae bacterium]|nr:hypothetical protein [Methylophilaceae bacterium]
MPLNILRGLPLLRLLAIAYGLFALAPAIAGQGLPLAWVRDVPLPGSSTRMDYQSLDPQSGLLFIAHLGG